MTVADPVVGTIPDAVLFEAFLAKRRDDPLSAFRFASEPQRVFVSYVAQGLETLLRGGNSSGKTAPGAALFVALARGIEQLAGIALPKLKLPATGWCLTQTYKQQVDSSQAAVLKYLGNHPHKIAWVAGETKGYVESIWVATDRCIHGMDEKCRTCSRLVFHCAESSSAVGGRIDFAWADEPPEEKTWREIRMRGRGDQRFIRYITATPLARSLWEWMKKDFTACERKPANGRIEVRTSIYDNRFLSPAVLKDKIDAMKGDGFEDARINGDYVNIEGTCPFDFVTPDGRRPIRQWLDRVRPPQRTETITVDGIQSVVSLGVQIFEEVIPGASYVAVWDPSSGVKSSAHDPAGGLLFRRASRPALAVRFNGYVDPFSLGVLAAVVGKRYNNALTDVDMTGGYGTNTVTAMLQRRYYNLNRDYHEDRPGQTSMRYGFTITSVNRSEITTAIVRALIEDSIDYPSAEGIDSLLTVEVNKVDKWLAASGFHDEEMICLGRILHLMATLPAPSPVRRDRSKSPFAALLQRSFGRQVMKRAQRAPEGLEVWE